MTNRLHAAPGSFALLAASALALSLSGCSGSSSNAPAVPGNFQSAQASAAVRSLRSALPAGKKPPGLTLLYSFGGAPDGYFPYGSIVIVSGNIYGTTSYGGSGGDGTVFELTPAGSTYGESILHSFTGPDGQTPIALQSAKGDLFVTAEVGGANSVGTALELSRTGKQIALTSFDGSAAGSYPEAPGLLDQKTTIYTTTYAGGTYNSGTIVALSAHGLTTTAIYNFTGGSDGGFPQAGLIADAHGDLYGTTYGGGSAGLGTVFKLSPGKSGTESVLWSFQGGNDGANPTAGLTFDASGDLFGTTLKGGSAGDGVVFVVKHVGNSESVIHTFTGPPDGSTPYAGLTVQGKMLYGTTFEGGGGAECSGGCGTIYEIATSGKSYAILHNFGSTDGSNPSFGSLIARGNALYGATVDGGTAGYGTVFSFAL